jgi:hypothetical protein
MATCPSHAVREPRQNTTMQPAFGVCSSWPHFSQERAFGARVEGTPERSVHSHILAEHQAVSSPLGGWKSQ